MGLNAIQQLRADGNDAVGPTILLLRHGQIKANRVGRWHGSTDSDLTFKGRRQARRTSKLLDKTTAIHKVVASPLARCQQTASLATRHLELEVESHPGLAEMGIGEWENMPFTQLHEEHDLFTKLTTDTEFRPPGGETISEVCERALGALRQIAAGAPQDEVILVVSHGITMGIALAALLESEPTRWRDYQMANCALSELSLLPEPCLFGFNQMSHT